MTFWQKLVWVGAALLIVVSLLVITRTAETSSPTAPSTSQAEYLTFQDRSGQGSGASVLAFPPEVRLRPWSARPQRLQARGRPRETETQSTKARRASRRAFRIGSAIKRGRGRT